MMWKEIKSWAKGCGYICDKKDDHYTWYKDSNPGITGSAPSVSKLAKSVFNDMTGNIWLTHQEEYRSKSCL